MSRLIELQNMLATMHTYGRPHGSLIERQFLARYVVPTGATEDEFGNWRLDIPRADGSPSRVVWSCHTDTVHRIPRMQRTRLTRPGVLKLARREVSNCLGADDTVGVFLCLQLIAARMPGRYLFHYGEEVGCLGSQAIACETPGVLTGIDYAIAFDRAGQRDIITHQMCRRTASDAFAASLADMLNRHPDLSYRASDRGVYTDTESYADLLPECTNLSVGYECQHNAIETVDTIHVVRLLDAILSYFDEADLVCARVPGPPARPLNTLSMFTRDDDPLWEDDDDDLDDRDLILQSATRARMREEAETHEDLLAIASAADALSLADVEAWLRDNPNAIPHRRQTRRLAFCTDCGYSESSAEFRIDDHTLQCPQCYSLDCEFER